MTPRKIDLSMSLPFEVVDGEMSDSEVIEMVLKASRESKLSQHINGTVIDSKYKIISLLGEGGMGSVYSVLHVLLNKEMALKTFRTADLSAEAWQRFQREAQAIGKLAHANIIQVFDFGISEQNFPYYTMELLVGESLADRLQRQGRMGMAEALGTFIPVANGLAHAHRQGIVHRDIKPANIYLQRGKKTSSPKIVDFGLAKLASSQSREIQSLTAVGVVFGSPLYMSPEQSRGREMDERTDIYSFGCTLFQVLTGNPPFLGDNPVEVVQKHQKQVPPLLVEADPHAIFPEELEDIIAKLLAKDPSRRYQSFEEVEKDLASLLADSTVTRSTAKKAVPSPSAENKSETRQEAERALSDERLPATNVLGGGPIVFVLILVALALMGFIGTAFFLYDRNEQSPNTVNGQVVNGAETAESNSPYYSKKTATGSTIFDFPVEDTGIGMVSWEGQKDRPAAGLIEVPAGRHVHLMAGPRLTEQPDLLRRFRPDDLTELSVPRASVWISQNFEELSHLTGLQSLDLSGTSVGSSHIPYLNRLTNLIQLNVSSTGLIAADLAGLSRLPQLQSLTVDKLDNLAPLLDKLENSEAMMDLSLDHCDLTDDDLMKIASMANLKSLSINFSSYTVDSLRHLASVPDLETLQMESKQVEPQVIDILAGFTKLRRLRVQTDSWSDADKAHLQEALPKDCKLEG